VVKPGATVIASEPDADAITEQTGVAVDQRVGVRAGSRRHCSLANSPEARSDHCVLWRQRA
jgi:hypothetical protein